MLQTWFTAKVKYLKVAEGGSESMVKEQFLLDAVSYTDAEARIIGKMQEMVKGGEFAIDAITKSRIAEVFPFEEGEWWFKATIHLVTIDEEAGKEKRITTHYLIMADDIDEALARLKESLEYLVIPYKVTSLAVSQIVDVFPYEPRESAERVPEGFVPVEKTKDVFTPFSEENGWEQPAEHPEQ